jgi:hypothetical protein
MHWASLMTSTVAAAGRIPIELVDRLIDYCLDCECTQEQSTDLWPEYNLSARELQRGRVNSSAQTNGWLKMPAARTTPGGWRFVCYPPKLLAKVRLIHESTFKRNVAQ